MKRTIRLLSHIPASSRGIFAIQRPEIPLKTARYALCTCHLELPLIKLRSRLKAAIQKVVRSYAPWLAYQSKPQDDSMILPVPRCCGINVPKLFVTHLLERCIEYVLTTSSFTSPQVDSSNPDTRRVDPDRAKLRRRWDDWRRGPHHMPLQTDIQKQRWSSSKLDNQYLSRLLRIARVR